MNFPVAETEGSVLLHDALTIERLLELTAAVWEQDWATFTSSYLRESQNAPPRTPVLGWITYFADRRGRPAPQIPGVAVLQATKGTIIRLDGPASDLDPERIGVLRRALESGGFLDPIP